jgi:hypothetical protein
MQSIMGGEIAYSFRRSDLSVDKTTKSDGDLFRLPAISQFGYVPDDLLFMRWRTPLREDEGEVQPYSSGGQTAGHCHA